MTQPQTENLELEKIFGPNGPLATSLNGYEARREQVEVASSIEYAMSEGLPCLAEAGTGVGKTLAYLIPAIREALNGRITIISTHTIGLQQQLIEKDIPVALKQIKGAKGKINVTLLKGRSNYLCEFALQEARSNLMLVEDPVLKRVEKANRDSDWNGDVGNLPFRVPFWSELTSTPETCRSSDCAFYETCHFYQARREAQDAHILVVNHALFLSDLAIRASDPNASLLPSYHHVVFDEAHHLEDVATKTFGVEFNSHRIPGIVERLRRLKLDVGGERLLALDHLNDDLFAPLLTVGRMEFDYNDSLDSEIRTKVENAAVQIVVSLQAIQNMLLDAAKEDPDQKEVLEGLGKMCERSVSELSRLFSEPDEGSLRWCQCLPVSSAQSNINISIHLTPIAIAPKLEELLWKSERMVNNVGSVTLISATLANSGGFSYIRSRMGIPSNAVECLVGSPFPFKDHALLYVPGHLSEPVTPPTSAYQDALADEIQRLISLTNGRAFLLFTSRSMLNAIYQRLQSRVNVPLFKQGDQAPVKLLEAFRASGNGCLLGVQTFWEGVDIQGDALSCVVIDRIPFAVPDSPINRARTKAITESGGDWFREYAIPQAQIRLKQGFGRLIRTHSDKGIVCILDTRMMTKAYGKEFVKYLPPAKRASLWKGVEKFWTEVCEK